MDAVRDLDERVDEATGFVELTLHVCSDAGRTSPAGERENVGDVADACVNALDNRATYGRTYELAGPRIYTLKELVQFAARASGHPRPVLGLPGGLARVQAMLMELAPGEPLMSRDNLDSMKRDNIASQQPYAPAPELGIELHPMESEAALYLAGQNPRSHLGAFRARARR